MFYVIGYNYICATAAPTNITTVLMSLQCMVIQTLKPDVNLQINCTNKFSKIKLFSTTICYLLFY